MIFTKLFPIIFLAYFVSAAPVPSMEYGQHPQLAALPVVRTLPLADTRRGGLSADDYIQSHSMTTNSEGFTTDPVAESSLVRGPALTRRGLQEVDPSQMHTIVPAGHGNLDKHQELREEVMGTPTVAE
ncbi:hypothetical protein CPB97_009979 [Podila verticillata]|nr:hypothetical protein CPB97_009979 [Podila verticillata]